MDLEEIKCALCSQIYNEHDRMPILLPDCGHSFCYACIQGCFDVLKEDQMQRQSQIYAEEEVSPTSMMMDHHNLSTPSKREASEDYSAAETVIMDAPPKIFEEIKHSLMFKCPEDR